MNNDTDIPHGRPTEYEGVMQWYDKGYVTSISPELVVNYLPGYVVWWDDKDRYEAEKLYNYSLTLEKHIWLLFQRQSLLASSSYSYSKYWPLILKKIADDNKINRIHLLRELLLTATNSEMNKPLINWFVDVFNILTPTDDELLHIQDELLIVLNSPQSKPVSNALKHLTKICSSEDFKLDNFISILPLNITSSIKAIVVGCIEISELLLKTKSKCSNEICTIVYQ